MSSSTLAAGRSRARVATFVILGLLALVAAFSWRGTASAEGSYPPALACTVSTGGPVTPGSTPTIVGSGFAPNEAVTLSLQPGGLGLGSLVTTATGTFSQQVTIPANLTGSHTIQAAAASSTCSFGPISGGSGVDGVSAGSPGPTSGIAGVSASRGLASTGFATITASAIGLALLGGGALFLFVGRRRKA